MTCPVCSACRHCRPGLSACGSKWRGECSSESELGGCSPPGALPTNTATRPPVADAPAGMHNAPSHSREEKIMAGKQVKYYFAFPSPFAALADSRIDDLIAQAGAELVPIPIVPPPADPPTGIAAQIAEFKLSYLLEDAERWAHKLGLPWHAPAQVRRRQHGRGRRLLLRTRQGQGARLPQRRLPRALGRGPQHRRSRGAGRLRRQGWVVARRVSGGAAAASATTTKCRRR